MAQPQIFQGTWEELAVRAAELRNHRNLLLIVPAEETARSSDVPGPNDDAIEQQSAESRRAAQITAIHAGMGKFHYNGSAVEELHRERQRDREREEEQIRNYNR